jgi:fumarate reductase subunit D
MPRLTPLEKTRMALVAITLLSPLATCGVAVWKWSAEEAVGLPYPLRSAMGNIAAAYMPILVIVFGFLWTLGKRPKPPKGDPAMDLTANVVAVFVFAVTLGIPVLIYGFSRLGEDANESMVLYSSLMHTLLSAAMVYYFGKPLVEEPCADEQRGARAPATR